jgi:hypothetical protein
VAVRHLLASGLQEESTAYLVPHAVAMNDSPRSVKFLCLLWNKPAGDAIFSAIAQKSDHHLQVALKKNKIPPAELDLSKEDIQELQTEICKVVESNVASFAVNALDDDVEKGSINAESLKTISQLYLYGTETAPASKQIMILAVWDGVYEITSLSHRVNTFLRIDGIQDTLYVGSLEDVLAETEGCKLDYNLPDDGTSGFQIVPKNVILKFPNSINDNGISIRKFGSTKAFNESWTGQSYIPPAQAENRPWYDHAGVGPVLALLGLLGGVQ